MAPTFDCAGSGPAIVFLHAAIGDRRMWHPQWDHFVPTNMAVRVDLCGFGDNPPRREPFSNRADVIAILDEVGIETATIVGASMGARVALGVAADYPERVAGLVLVGAGVADHEWSSEVQDFWQVESDALDAGDIDLAVQANIAFWVDGPRRKRARLSEADRTLVAAMQRQAFEHELTTPNAAPEERLTDLAQRLPHIAGPTRVLYGNEDALDIIEIAEMLAAELPTASLHCVSDTAHLPSLEAPDEVNAHIAAVLDQVN